MLPCEIESLFVAIQHSNVEAHTTRIHAQTGRWKKP